MKAKHIRSEVNQAINDISQAIFLRDTSFMSSIEYGRFIRSQNPKLLVKACDTLGLSVLTKV